MYMDHVGVIKLVAREPRRKIKNDNVKLLVTTSSSVTHLYA